MIEDFLELIVLIARWVEQGLNREAILERLSQPDNAGRHLLDRAIARRKAGQDYLGRKDSHGT